MYVIGARPYTGLYTKDQFKQGKIPNPGSRASTIDANGQTREYVAVKLAAGTLINGIAVIIDGLSAAYATGAGAVSVTASGSPTPAINARLGILAFASATATQTMAGTAFGWAQIYGAAIAWSSVGPSAPGIQMTIGSNGQLTQATLQVSASNQVMGITAITTASTTTPTLQLVTVMLNYPHFAGFPDANLA